MAYTNGVHHKVDRAEKIPMKLTALFVINYACQSYFDIITEGMKGGGVKLTADLLQLCFVFWVSTLEVSNLYYWTSSDRREISLQLWAN